MFSYETFAINHKDRYIYFGNLRIMKMYGCDNPIPVRLVEDPNGEYLTWLPSNSDIPRMTLYAKIFNIQFPYGYETEEQAGNGKAIRVRVEKIVR